MSHMSQMLNAVKSSRGNVTLFIDFWLLHREQFIYLEAKIWTHESQPILHQYGQTYCESQAKGQAREGHWKFSKGHWKALKL